VQEWSLHHCRWCNVTPITGHEVNPSTAAALFLRDCCWLQLVENTDMTFLWRRFVGFLSWCRLLSCAFVDCTLMLPFVVGCLMLLVCLCDSTACVPMLTVLRVPTRPWNSLNFFPHFHGLESPWKQVRSLNFMFEVLEIWVSAAFFNYWVYSFVKIASHHLFRYSLDTVNFSNMTKWVCGYCVSRITDRWCRLQVYCNAKHCIKWVLENTAKSSWIFFLTNLWEPCVFIVLLYVSVLWWSLFCYHLSTSNGESYWKYIFLWILASSKWSEGLS